MITLAPFETLKDKYLRIALLRELKPCVPRHFQGEVFAGVSMPESGVR